MVIIALPVILQPGHYLLIDHEHYQPSEQNSVNTENEHFKCSIDDFQLTEVPLHPFLEVSQVICLDFALSLPHKQINTKSELNIPFSLRAPPLL